MNVKNAFIKKQTKREITKYTGILLFSKKIKMQPETTAIASQMVPAFSQGTIILLGLLMVRGMIWKGIALWKAGTKKQLARFIFIFIFNTAGILPIIYLAFFQKKEEE